MGGRLLSQKDIDRNVFSFIFLLVSAITRWRWRSSPPVMGRERRKMTLLGYVVLFSFCLSQVERNANAIKWRQIQEKENTFLFISSISYSLFLPVTGGEERQRHLVAADPRKRKYVSIYIVLTISPFYGLCAFTPHKPSPLEFLKGVYNLNIFLVSDFSPGLPSSAS